MKRSGLLLGLILVVGIAPRGSLLRATQNALVTGTVYDGKTGDPLAGATVHLTNPSTGFAVSETTDAHGVYTFPSVPPAEEYVFSVEKAGYEPAFRPDQRFNVGDNKYVMPPFTLLPAEQAAVETKTPAAAPTAAEALPTPAPTEAPPRTTPPAPTEVAPQPTVPPGGAAKAAPTAQPAAPPSTPPRQLTVAPQPPPATLPRPKPTSLKPAVSGPTVSLDLASTMLGGVIDSQAVRTLPLGNRDFLDLALLVPGTYPVEQGSALEGASLVVNGTRANMNNFLLDGVDNNDYTINQSLPFQIVEALQEFRVQAGASPAEYGRSGGAQINSITRSGTNKLHGTFFDFNRNSALSSKLAISAYRGGTFDAFKENARLNAILGGTQPFNPTTGLGTFFPTPILNDPVLNQIWNSGRDPHFNQNQFGANLGGPAIKDKAFFFFNWETSRAVDNRPDFERVPDLTCRANLNACSMAVFGVPPQLPVSAAQFSKILNLYPRPNVTKSKVLDSFGNPINDPAAGDLTGDLALFAGDSGNFANSDNFLERFDYRIGDRVSMSFKHNLQNIDQVQGGSIPKSPNPQTNTYPGNGISVKGRNQNFSYNLVNDFSSRTVNEARLGWNRFRLATLPLDHSVDPSSIFRNLSSTRKGFPEVLMGGFSTLGPYATLGASLTAPSNRANNLYSAADNVNLTRGRHVIKLGGEFRYNRLDVDNEGTERGLVAMFNVPFVAATGEPDIASVTRVAPQFGGVNGKGGLDRSFRANSAAGFVQDSWRPRSNLTVNLGLRYEVNQAPVESRNRLVNNYPNTCGLNALVCLIRGGTKTVLDSDGTILGSAKFTAPRAGFDTDYNNFGPQFGLAWDPRGNGKTVFRAGYALTYDQQSLEPSANMLLNPPYIQQTASLSSLFDLADTFPPGFQTAFGDFSFDPTSPDSKVFGPSIWFAQPYSITARDSNSRTPYVHQYHAGIQRQLGSKAMFEVAYEGSVGHKLLRNRLRLECPSGIFNSSLNVSCLPPLGGILGTRATGLREDVVVNQENSANSNFHSLMARFETRTYHGLTLHAHYQWAHSIDNASSAVAPVFFFSPTSASILASILGINANQFVAVGNANPTLSLRSGLSILTTQPLLPSDANNSANLQGQRAGSDFDARHRVVVYSVYDLPKAASLRAFGNGWELAGIATFQSGQPFTVFGNFFGVPLRPSEINQPKINFGNPEAAFDNATPAGCNNGSFADRCAGTAAKSAFNVSNNFFFRSGSLPRNSFAGPRYANFDFSILKNTYFGRDGRINIQIRAEFFNLFNHTNLRQPYSNSGLYEEFPGSGAFVQPDPFFGEILQARSPRQIQFGLKVIL